MKSWLVFLGGGVCGAAVALGVTRIFFPTGDVGMNGVTGERARAGAAVSGTTDQVKSDEAAKEAERALDERIAGLRAWTEGREKEPLLGDLNHTLAEWAERDPYAALAWVQGAKRLPKRLQLLSMPLAALAKKNPAEAAQWMRQHVDDHDRSDVLESAYQFLAGLSPRVALELAMAFPEKEQPYDLGNALGELAGKSPQDALMFFNRMGRDRQIHSAHGMISEWAESDPAAVLRWAEGQPELMEARDLKGTMLAECARARPDLCLDFIRKYPISSNSWEGTRAVSVMLTHSPEHGLAALALLPPDGAAGVLGMWAQGSFERSPERAVELVKQWVPEAGRAEVLRDGFEAWLNSDQRSALEWLGGVTEPQLRATLQAGVIAWQAERDPESALAVLNGPQAASPELKDVVERALVNWAYKDASSAAGWMVANPGLVTAHQASEVAGLYLSQNEEAAADWLAKLPAGEARDAAVETAALHWASADELGLATQVAGSIRDADKRQRVLFGVYNTLKDGDVAAAEAWLAGMTELSEETKRSWRTLAGGR